MFLCGATPLGPPSVTKLPASEVCFAHPVLEANHSHTWYSTKKLGPESWKQETLAGEPVE